MICDLKDINTVIKSEGLNILVVSYGGCCSNTLVKTLEKNHYKCISNTWAKILCHCPHYIQIDIPTIYIYDTPIKSFLSMKRRGAGFYDVNQRKLSNNNDVVLSDENLLKLMIKQFNSWTKIKRHNVLVLKSSELFKNDIVPKLTRFLKKNRFLIKPIQHFPIVYKNPETIELTPSELFEKYKVEIEQINNFKSNG